MLTRLKMYAEPPKHPDNLVWEIICHLGKVVGLQVTARPRLPDTFTERRFNSWGQFPNLLHGIVREKYE